MRRGKTTRRSQREGRRRVMSSTFGQERWLRRLTDEQKYDEYGNGVAVNVEGTQRALPHRVSGWVCK
jgi:hypothetical protein